MNPSSLKETSTSLAPPSPSNCPHQGSPAVTQGAVTSKQDKPIEAAKPANSPNPTSFAWDLISGVQPRNPSRPIPSAEMSTPEELPTLRGNDMQESLRCFAQKEEVSTSKPQPVNPELGRDDTASAAIVEPSQESARQSEAQDELPEAEQVPAESISRPQTVSQPGMAQEVGTHESPTMQESLGSQQGRLRGMPNTSEALPELDTPRQGASTDLQNLNKAQVPVKKDTQPEVASRTGSDPGGAEGTTELSGKSRSGPLVEDRQQLDPAERPEAENKESFDMVLGVRGQSQTAVQPAKASSVGRGNDTLPNHMEDGQTDPARSSTQSISSLPSARPRTDVQGSDTEADKRGLSEQETRDISAAGSDLHDDQVQPMIRCDTLQNLMFVLYSQGLLDGFICIQNPLSVWQRSTPGTQTNKLVREMACLASAWGLQECSSCYWLPLYH